MVGSGVITCMWLVDKSFSAAFKRQLFCLSVGSTVVRAHVESEEEWPKIYKEMLFLEIVWSI